MKREQTSASATSSYRSHLRYALGAVFVGLVGFAIHLASKHDPIEANAAAETTAKAGPADPKAWTLDAVPEEVLAQRLAHEAAQRLAQPPANHIPVRPNDMPHPPRDALAASPLPPQSFAGAATPNLPPSQNPGGVNGSRPARPVPGLDH